MNDEDMRQWNNDAIAQITKGDNTPTNTLDRMKWWQRVLHRLGLCEKSRLGYKCHGGEHSDNECGWRNV